MIEADRKTAQLTINVRYPVTFNDKQIYEGIMAVLDGYDLGIVKGKHQEPIYVPDDDPLVTTLVDIYRRYTGDGRKPLVIGGGTYAVSYTHLDVYKRQPLHKDMLLRGCIPSREPREKYRN